MKTLPCSLESEQALLGACFLRPWIISQVRAMLQPDSFYREAHGIVFEAICDLGKSAEPASVGEWLTSKGLMEKTGGPQFLLDLSECVSTSAGWAYHAGVIREKATRREIIRACAIASDQAYGIDEPDEILTGLKDSVRSLNSEAGKPYADTDELVMAVWHDIERRQTAGERFVGVATGFKGIDQQIYGLEPKTTIYLIARPSIGKTALALNIADNIPGRVAYFSLESNAEALTRRRMAAKSDVHLWRIRTAQMESGHLDDLRKASTSLCDTSLIILDKPYYKTVENLTAQCESMAMDGPISLIVIDHIQRMRSRKRLQNRHLELSWISEELSTLAKNLNVPILILCQLSREIEKRQVKKQYPQLSDMKESGDLEANADQVWGLWREDKESEYARLECLKGRDTGTWTAHFKFDRHVQRFFDGVAPGPLNEKTEDDRNYMDK